MKDGIKMCCFFFFNVYSGTRTLALSQDPGLCQNDELEKLCRNHFVVYNFIENASFDLSV